MKERPIIFSGEMVRAILEGRKTQTRRVVKTQHDCSFDGLAPAREYLGRKHFGSWGAYFGWAFVPCPYGQPGDRLYVKERWRPSWANVAGMVSGPGIEYEDGTILGRPEASRYPECETPSRSKWRSSRFMPRFASRILLEVTDVRVERVQDISEADALAEGVEYANTGADSALGAWPILWDSINAKRGHGWDSNPWAWCVSFRKL